MNELPFATPANYEPASFIEQPGEGLWFVFKGDQLMVEMGPPDPRPTDDLRVRSRPSWARLPVKGALQKNHNWLGSDPLRTLYLGRLGGQHCYAAEVAGEAP